jgi:DNA-binding transcriptional LysR family regulator
MNFNDLNLNQLKVFQSVFKNRSMTAAATDLHLTQSGVSQHIKSLEDMLGVPLFDRVKQKIIPTQSAALLFTSCESSLKGLESTLFEIKGVKARVYGKVALGMPIEFGNNILVPLLSDFGKQYTEVTFSLTYGFATQMNEDLLKGDLDFAFVDDFQMDARIEKNSIYDEELVLVASPEFLKQKSFKAELEQKYFEKLEVVDYQPGAPLVRRWLQHHFKGRDGSLNLRANAMDVQGVARLILNGLGAGVLPRYAVDQLKQDGKRLHVFEGSGQPLKNKISVARLAGRTQTMAAQLCLDYLKESVKKGACRPRHGSKSKDC